MKEEILIFCSLRFFYLFSLLIFYVGPWTEEEDAKVMELVLKNGPQKWTFIADHLPGRIGKQCRER